jgi:hypothetical protein
MRGALLAMLALGACARGGSVSDDDGAASGTDAAVADASADAPLPDAPPAPADACVPMTTQLLANPALDLTPMGTNWEQQRIDSGYPLITGQDGSGVPGEHSPPYKAWLGGFNGTNVTDVLHQDVAIPAKTSRLVLTGFYQVRTNETSSNTAYDTASVALTQTTNNTPIETVLAVSNLTPRTEWTAFAHTFTQNVSGQTVRLRFTSSSDASRSTSFFFDTLVLAATHGCP